MGEKLKEEEKRILEEKGLLTVAEVNKEIFDRAKEMLEGYGFVRVQQMSRGWVETNKNAKYMVRIREHRIEIILFSTDHDTTKIGLGINQSAFYLNNQYFASDCDAMKGYKTEFYKDLFVDIEVKINLESNLECKTLFIKKIFNEEWEKGMKVQIENILKYFDDLGGFEGYCNLADTEELLREYYKINHTKTKFDEEWEKGIKPQKEKGVNNFVGFGENNNVSNAYEIIKKHRDLKSKDNKIADEIFNYYYEYDIENQIKFSRVGESDDEYIYLEYGRAINSFINGEYEKGEKLMRDTMKEYPEDSDPTNEKDIKEMKCFVEILDEKMEDWQEKIQEKIKALEKDALAEAWGVELDENGKTIKKKKDEKK